MSTKKRSNQPQQITPIDWSNPLTRRLVLCHNAVEKYDSALGKIIPVSGNTRSILNNAIGQSYSGANARADYSTFRPIPIDSSSYTILACGVWPATGRGHAFSQGYQVSPYPQYTLAYGISNTGAGANGTVTLFEYSSPNVLSSATVSGAADGKYHCVVGRRNGSASNTTVWIDGISKTVSTNGNDGTINSSGQSNQTTSIGNDANYSSTGREFNSPLFLVLVWSRALAYSEIKAISDNPWQVFAQQRSPLALITPPAATETASASITTSAPSIAIVASGDASAAASITTLNPAISADVTGQFNSSVAITTVNPTIAINATGDAGVSCSITTVKPTFDISVYLEVSILDGFITTPAPFISINVSEGVTVSLDAAITTSAPVIAVTVSSNIIASTSVTTVAPTVAAVATSLTNADVSITTASPVVAASTTVGFVAISSITTSNPVIAADITFAPTVLVDITTSRPTVSAAVTVSVSAIASIQTVAPIISAAVTGLATTSVSITTANPVIDSLVYELRIANAAITTSNPVISANTSGYANTDVILTTLSPIITIGADCLSIADVTLTTSLPFIAGTVLDKDYAQYVDWAIAEHQHYEVVSESRNYTVICPQMAGIVIEANR